MKPCIPKKRAAATPLRNARRSRSSWTFDDTLRIQMPSRTLNINPTDIPLWDAAEAEFGADLARVLLDFLQDRIGGFDQSPRERQFWGIPDLCSRYGMG